MKQRKRLKQLKKLKIRKSKITLNGIIASYTGNYKPVEINWSKPVGKEIV